MDGAKETLGTQEWLHSAQYTVSLDTDLLSGDGLIADIAAECFAMGDDGLEYVRFGKIRSLTGGLEMQLPVPAHLLARVVEAAERHPGECVLIEPLPEGQSPERAWSTFFEAAVRETHDYLESINDSLSREPINSHLLARINQPGGLLAYSHVREAWRIHNMQTALRYVASVVDPSPHATTMDPTPQDSFDVLQHLGISGADDMETRQAVAAELRYLLADGGLYKRGSTLEIEALMAKACSYLQPPQA